MRASSSGGVACVLMDLCLGRGLQGASGCRCSQEKTKQPRVIVLASKGTESLMCEFERHSSVT